MAVTQCKTTVWIKFKLVLKTICKKLYLKCQDNARFSSLYLASENVVLTYFYSKNGHNSEGNYLIRKKMTLVLKTTYNNGSLQRTILGQFNNSFVFGVWECMFEQFLLKKDHNSVEKGCLGKKFKLVLKITYKKLFLKYQLNTRFRSLCLTSKYWFLTYFYSKQGHNSVENGHLGEKIYPCSVLKSTNEAFPKISGQCKVSFIVFGLCECFF